MLVREPVSVLPQRHHGPQPVVGSDLASAHFVARAAYRAEGVDVDLDGPDDLRTLVGRHHPDAD